MNPTVEVCIRHQNLPVECLGVCGHRARQQSEGANMKVIPIHPKDVTALLEPTVAVPSRRTFGGRIPSRRTFGGKMPSRRTFGGKIPSRRVG